MRRFLHVLAALSLLCLFVACEADATGDAGGPGTAQPGADQQKPDTDDPKVVDGKTDQWNYTNNPSRFQIQFDYSFATLIGLTSGRAAQPPWPSDYWSYYEDSINVRYHGSNQLSPAEKYDQAFYGWTPKMDLLPVDLHVDCDQGQIKDTHAEYYDHLGKAAKWQHRNKGNYRARNGVDDDGDGQTDECGGDDYDGIETWWGLCHAWVPAAILEPEPQKPVTVNDVTFTVSDIKALLIATHDRNRSYMLGGRCNEKEVERDEHGRLTQDQCRDTNAGAFFVVITNMLGISQRAFAEDRTGGYQVWNQPVFEYEIKEHREVSEAEAVELLGRAGVDYNETFDSPDSEAWYYVKMDVGYITESSNSVEGSLTAEISRYTRYDHYELIVEVNADGDVVGGEWLNYSRETHPDFLWLPVGTNGGNPHISLGQVRRLLELSRATEEPGPGGETGGEYKDEVSIPIPDADPIGISRTIEVADDMQVDALKVAIDIEHTWRGDLRVVLSKDGVDVVLHDKTGGGADNLQETFTVDDFNGMSAKGDWTLTVTDTASRDTGSLKSWSLIVGSGSTEPADTRVYANDAALSIPDDAESGVASTLAITDSGTIRKLDVTIDITHTYIGDLVITLEKNGQSQVLHQREGGSDDDIAKTFSTSAFNGAAVKGEWTLKVQDLAGQDVGTLNSWKMEVKF